MSQSAAYVESEWMPSGLCTQTDPEVFFPSSAGSHAQAEEAKKVCRRCDERTQCLEWSLKRQEPFGVWGGVDERERRRLLASTAVPAQR